MSVVFSNSERMFTNYPLSWFHPSIPCHLAPTRTPLLRPSSCPGFANVMRHVAHSSIRGSRYRCFRNRQKNHSTASSCQAFSKHTSKMPSMMASLQGLLARPSTETSWTKLGEVRTQVRQLTAHSSMPAQAAPFLKGVR